MTHRPFVRWPPPVKGIFVCGAFAGPKDIPQSVVEAEFSGGRGGGTAHIDARNTLTKQARSFPQERSYRGRETPASAYSCASAASTSAAWWMCPVGSGLRGIPSLCGICDRQSLYTCSQDTQQTMSGGHSRKQTSTASWWPPVPPRPMKPCSRKPWWRRD